MVPSAGSSGSITGWGDYRLTWLNLWPVLPGFVVGAVLFHPQDVLEFTAMGTTTLLLLIGLNWLGSGGRYRLAAAGIALALAIPQAFLTYAAFRA